MSRMSLRRLHPDLRIVDERLVAWAAWSRRMQQNNLGFPRVSSIARAIEYGATGAAIKSGPQPIECPEPIAKIDRLVALLPDRQKQAILANYTSSEQPREVKARMAKQSLGSFHRSLDVARWSLRFALGVD